MKGKEKTKANMNLRHVLIFLIIASVTIGMVQTVAAHHQQLWLKEMSPLPAMAQSFQMDGM